MPCLNADGSLTRIAEDVLRAVAATPAATPEAIARATGLPLYRTRSSLRELGEAGLLVEQHGVYRITPHGESLGRVAGEGARGRVAETGA